MCTASGGDSCSNNAHRSDLSCCCCAGAEGRQLAASIAQRWLLTMFESWSSTGTKFFHKSAFNCANGLMCTALLMSWVWVVARQARQESDRVLTCALWGTVVEKYDATALGVSGGGGEYSVQSGRD